MNRFDVAAAFYRYAMLYHGGQWSPEYRIFGRLDRMRYRPDATVTGHGAREFAREYPDGWELYKRLVRGESRVR